MLERQIEKDNNVNPFSRLPHEVLLKILMIDLTPEQCITFLLTLKQFKSVFFYNNYFVNHILNTDNESIIEYMSRLAAINELELFKLIFHAKKTQDILSVKRNKYALLLYACQQAKNKSAIPNYILDNAFTVQEMNDTFANLAQHESLDTFKFVFFNPRFKILLDQNHDLFELAFYASCARRDDNTSILEFLLKQKSFVVDWTKRKINPLNAAVVTNNLATIEVLLNFEKNLCEKDPHRKPLSDFSDALSYASSSKTILCLSKRFNINAIDENGETQLLKAMRLDQHSRALAFINANADVNIKNTNSQMTALHYAVNWRTRTWYTDKINPTIRLLFQHGADICAKNTNGLAPSDVAIYGDVKNLLSLAEINLPQIRELESELLNKADELEQNPTTQTIGKQLRNIVGKNLQDALYNMGDLYFDNLKRSILTTLPDETYDQTIEDILASIPKPSPTYGRLFHSEKTKTESSKKDDEDLKNNKSKSYSG